MDQEMRLKDTHDVSEALQNNIESLPDVERAFVHVDYNFGKFMSLNLFTNCF
jgi:divalent metal cation (Fe/Co/Zn/Cd) transporter